MFGWWLSFKTDLKMQKVLEFEMHINEKEYMQFCFYSTYTSKIIIYITLVCVLLCFATLFVALSSNSKLETKSFVFLLILVGLIIYIPFSVYRNSKKNYHSKGARFTEKMLFTIDDQWINTKGESFETNRNWEKILRVKETKNWFLIYENKMNAHIINKRCLTEDKINGLRILIKSIPGLNAKLK